MGPMFALLSLLACGRDPVQDTGIVVDTEVVIDETDDPTDTAGPNDAPEGLEIALQPAVPAAGFDLTAVIAVPAIDADHDTVSYEYAWTVDGAVAAVDGAVVPAASVVEGQVWTVEVTPTDGVDDGLPRTLTATVGNRAPTPPVLSFSPTPPSEGVSLELIFDPPAVDPDGDALTTTIVWTENGNEIPWYADLTVIDKRYVSIDDTFHAVVSVTDGFHAPVTAEATIRVEYGCANLPPFNLGDRTITTASAYHGLDFDDHGNLIGQDPVAGALIKSDYAGASELWIPGMTSIQQIDRLPDGDFVVGDSGAGRLLRVTATGGTETIAGDFPGIYGVTVGPDGMVYVGSYGVYRVDPDTGDTETLLTGEFNAHDVDFNLDSTVMYIGTIGAGLLTVELDANLDIVGEPALFASGINYIDGVELDACGNVYVADYSSSNLLRIEPDGTLTPMVIGASVTYGHGITWGNGIGGWATDTIYQPQPYNGYTVREVVIGLQPGDSVRTWNGVAVPW